MWFSSQAVSAKEIILQFIVYAIAEAHNGKKSLFNTLVEATESFITLTEKECSFCFKLREGVA